MIDTNTKNEVIKKFAISKEDTGSVQVQIALMTERITDITKHAVKNPKDNSSKKGLLQLVAKRRKFLGYLKTNDQEQYRQIVERLGLRK